MSETSKRVLANEYIPGDSVRLAHEVQALEQERADLRAMGEKVNAIRDSAPALCGRPHDTATGAITGPSA